jgi:hypothetical protein
MGNTVAKNVATETINNTVGITTTQIANCMTLVNGAENLTVTASNDSTITITDTTILETSTYQIDQQCFANQSSNSSVNSQIAQTAAQQAKAVSQNIDLNTGSTTASNLANEITNSAISVSTLNYQSCLEGIIANQNITFNATNGSTINIKNVLIGFDDVTAAMNNCIFSQTSTSGVTQNISQSIQQAASATVEDSLAWILFAIAIIVAVFFFVSFKFIFWILIIFLVIAVLVGIYLIIARIKYWWPFRHPVPSLPATLSSGAKLTTSGPLTIPFSSKAGTFQFVFNFAQPTTPQTFTFSTGTYTTNFTIFPGLTQVTSNPVPLSGGTSSMILTLTSAGPIDFTSILGNIPGSPIKLGTGTTNLSTKSTTVTPTTPASFLVAGPSTTGQYIVTLNSVAATGIGIAPNLYILVDPGTSTGAVSGNPPTSGLGYFSALQAPTTPPAAGITVTTTPLTLNSGSNHNIYVTVDNGSVNISSITIAPSSVSSR